MNTDQAIEILENHLYGGKMPSKEHFEALAVAVQALKRQTEIDAVPVVRCRECVSYGVDAFGNNCCNYPEGLAFPDDNSYCCYGLRRRENKNNGS